VQPIKQFSPRILRERREAKGHSRQLLATAIGVSIGAVVSWERGEFQPRANQLALLAREFDCSIDELFEEGDDA
jgi:transcriptional regulator with XRE-family HTH domain